MKDTIDEIQGLDKEVNRSLGEYSQIIVDLFDDIAENIIDSNLNAGLTLYYVESLLDIFNPAKKEDIQILEQLKEKLERLIRVTL